MKRISVNSSNLSSVGFDQNSNTLEIEFNSGGIYQYYNVPESKYLELMNAVSHGKYFAANIKNIYRFRQIR